MAVMDLAHASNERKYFTDPSVVLSCSTADTSLINAHRPDAARSSGGLMNDKPSTYGKGGFSGARACAAREPMNGATAAAAAACLRNNRRVVVMVWIPDGAGG